MSGSEDEGVTLQPDLNTHYVEDPEDVHHRQVLILELMDAGGDEFLALTRAVMETQVPLILGCRVEMYTAVGDCADRVIDAYEGTNDV